MRVAKIYTVDTKLEREQGKAGKRKLKHKKTLHILSSALTSRTKRVIWVS